MKPSMNLSLFTTLSNPNPNPNRNVNSTKSPARIGILEGGVVGLGIVAAMTSSNESETHHQYNHNHHHHHHHQHLSPIPIVSSAKPAANFRGIINFDDHDHGHDLNDFIGNTCVLPNGVFSASPLNIGDPATHSLSSDFLNSCNLCNKLLHGLDIFIYRGERAFCSAECRETHIRNDDYQEKCRTGAMKPLDCSIPPCTGPPVSFAAGIVAA